MCEQCYVLKELFGAAESSPHRNYIPTLAFIHEMVKQDRMELFAGDCPLEKVKKQLDDEIHYTIQHYFICKSCGHYFLIGACIRGMPIYEMMDNVKNVNFDTMLWGRVGTLYER
jgi:hypothetical protein